MNIRNLEYMSALDETGSITAVAEKFFVSPSSVSQCLKKEERLIGCPLFQYKNHRMIPTEGGLIYLKGVRKILKIREETYEKLDVIPRNHNAIRIAAAPMLYQKVSEQIMPELNARMPDKPFSLLRTGTRVGLEYLSNDLADFALLCSPPLNNALITEENLGEDYLVLLAPKAYLRKRPGQETVMEDCATLPFILLRNGSYMRQAANEIMEKHQISLSRIYEVDDYIMVRSFLEEGRGAAFLPSSMVPENAERQFFILTPEPLKTFKFILAYPNYKKQDKQIRDIPRIIREIWQ